jgi:hypothetical protein
MLCKGFKEIGILKGSGSNSYHQLNPTSIGLSHLILVMLVILYKYLLSFSF